MRIYLPATTLDLAQEVGLSARMAHARTPALAELLGDADVEQGEFHALVAAAADSLELLRHRPATTSPPTGRGGPPEGPPHPLRVVVAADVDDVSPDGQEPSAVRVGPVPWARVVSLHVDDPDDGHGRELLRRAIAGDAEAVAAVADMDLLWYDVSEREHLLRHL